MMIDFDYFEPAAIKYRELKAQERLTVGIQVYIPLHKHLLKRGTLIAIHQSESLPYEVDFGTNQIERFDWYQLEVITLASKKE